MKNENIKNWPDVKNSEFIIFFLLKLICAKNRTEIVKNKYDKR